MQLTSQHRRLSYSRHAVNDRDLSTQVNYRMHFNMRRLVADKKHHHKRHSKKMNKVSKGFYFWKGCTVFVFRKGNRTTSAFPNSSKTELPNNSRMVSYYLTKGRISPRLAQVTFLPLDYITEVLHEDDTEPKSTKEDWDSPITFTAKSSREYLGVSCQVYKRRFQWRRCSVGCLF